MHDKKIADAYPLRLPPGSVLRQDLGFLGHALVGVVIEQPFKKPKNGTLTFIQQLYNQLFNAMRVVIEHANSGVKRLRMIQDVRRIHSARFFVIRWPWWLVRCTISASEARCDTIQWSRALV